MGPRAAEVVDAIEALYRFDLPNEIWLPFVAGRLSPLIDLDHMGQVAMTVHCPDPTSFTPTAVFEVDMPAKVSSAFRAGARGIPPEYVADGILSRPWCFSAGLEGWDRIPGNDDGAAAAAGIQDLLNVGCVEPDGRGCWFGSFQESKRQLSTQACLALTEVAQHLRSVYRLRTRIDDGEELADRASAVLDPGGRILDARGSARTQVHIDELTRAVQAMDASRTKRARGSVEHSFRSWRPRIGDDWTLVDSFERDGRRYVLAVQNRPRSPGFELLSMREREVVRQAVLGRHDKAIAYELGLAHSTVRVLMLRAVAKVGVRSRAELLERARLVMGSAE